MATCTATRKLRRCGTFLRALSVFALTLGVVFTALTSSVPRGSAGNCRRSQTGLACPSDHKNNNISTSIKLFQKCSGL
eukprot:4217655-Amphidinium_carterae.1